MSPPSLNAAVRESRRSPENPVRRPSRRAAVLTLARFHALAKTRELTVAGRYEMTGVWKRGGMARIYVAYDKETRKMVVLKIPKPEKDPNNPVHAHATVRELRALSLLDHPNIVRLKGVGRLQARDFIVLEHIPGCDLNTVLREFGKLPWPTAKGLLLKLCDALQAVHDSDIVHGDLKPWNVIVSVPTLEPVILDFGSARFTGENEALNVPSSNLLGSFPYMAPEMIGEDSYDQSADIHGLGLLAYEMLTRTNPFCDSNQLSMMLRIMIYKPDPPSSHVPEIPSTVDSVVMRAMAKDPADRFQTIGDMKEAIARCD